MRSPKRDRLPARVVAWFNNKTKNRCSIGVLYYTNSQFHDSLDTYSRALQASKQAQPASQPASQRHLLS